MPRLQTITTSLLRKPAAFYRFLRQFGITLPTLIAPSVLSLAASIFDGAALALLMPTINALLGSGDTALPGDSFIRPLMVFLPEQVSAELGGTLLILGGLILVCTLLKLGFRYFSDLALIRLVVRFGNNLRKQIFARYLAFGKQYFDENNIGRLYQNLTAHTDSVSAILRNSNSALYSISTLLVYFCVMFYISWKLTLVVMLAFPVMHFGMGSIITRIRRSSHSFVDSYKQLGKKITNSLSSIALVKSYNLEMQELERFSDVSEEVQRIQLSIARKQLLLPPLQELVLLGFLVLLLTLIAVLEESNLERLGQYAVFILMLRRASVHFNMMNALRGGLAEAYGPMSEIMKVFDDHDKYIVPDGEVEFDKLKDGIEIKNLNFSFTRGARTLHDVSISFRKGITTALVGQTGSGKTTLVNLVARFYDCPPGTIFIDGRDIREFTLSSWRRQIAIVSQEALLFHGTFRDNLLYGLQGQVSEEQIVSALERSRLLDLVSALPDGLETEIGDHGVKLSGGERQRLSIARAFLKNADILILDEPTSALDSRTEGLIQESLDALCRNRTVILIAHRLATIKNADHVVVLENGAVVEQGSTKELLAKQGAFFEYWGAQQIA